VAGWKNTPTKFGTLIRLIKQIRSRDTIDNLTFLPRLGVVYQPLKATAVYASYTQGFLPQTASNRSAGGPFPLKAAASTKQV